MEKCSYFIQDKALFGSFPSQATVDLLEEQGVRYFIDLTEEKEEKTIPYKTNYNYIKYPIKDRFYPTDWKSFAQLILKICRILTDTKDKIYIHCKGGHGRSGILVACVLCQLYKISPLEGLRKTSYYHSRRPVMRDKWRKIGSPQSKKQKDFVLKFFRPLFFYKPSRTSFSIGLHNQSPHPVTLEIGTFPNAYLAFQHFRSPNNEEYVQKLKEGIFMPELIINEMNENTKIEWNKNKVEYMYNVLENKFRQNEHIKKHFINTGLRPFVKVSVDFFWGNGDLGQGKNIQGKLLDKLRIKLLLEEENYLLPQQE